MNNNFCLKVHFIYFVSIAIPFLFWLLLHGLLFLSFYSQCVCVFKLCLLWPTYSWIMHFYSFVNLCFWFECLSHLHLMQLLIRFTPAILPFAFFICLCLHFFIPPLMSSFVLYRYFLLYHFNFLIIFSAITSCLQGWQLTS